MPNIRPYRGKRIDNGEWSTGDLINLLGQQGNGRKFIVDNRFGACIDHEGNFVNTEAPFVNEVDPETVGQYTGLPDINKKEIYSGDRFRIGDDVGTVVFEGGAYWVLWDEPYSWGIERALYRVYDEGEVIGNIHDNPELLKDGEVN